MRSRLGTLARKPLVELVVVLAFAVLLATAVQAYAVKPYEIPSGSMQPTLGIGQRVLVERFSTRLGEDPEPGDVVVFHPPRSAVAGDAECEAAAEQLDGQVCPLPGPEAAEETFIKRVVAGPGDDLAVVGGIPVVNGERYEGDWRIRRCSGESSCDFPNAITVPEDTYFVMGDNRPGSDDSRFWGPVRREWIIGKAFFTYWPPERVGGL